MKLDGLGPDDWVRVAPGAPQRIVRVLLSRPGRWWLRYRAFGHLPRVPEEGGFILAPAPHGAFMDPFIFGLGQPRRQLRFMAKYQALEWPVVGRIIRWAGGFPVHRGGGRSAGALEIATRVIDCGHGVVVFMEGKLVLDHDGLGTPRNGVARLALATGAPVVPVAAYGCKRARAYGKQWWQHRPRATLVWGEPLRFDREEAPSDERVFEVTESIWHAIVACFDEARQR